MTVCKNQLIMKYYSKFLVSSICQNTYFYLLKIQITYIKNFTIVNILGENNSQHS